MNTPSIHLADLTAPIVATLAVVFGLGIAAPATSFAQDNKEKARQNDKNLMRNLVVGLGAAAVYQGVKGKTTNAAILGAGAALAGKKYEDARKAQGRDNDNRYGYGYPGYNDNGRYDNDNNSRYGNDRYDRDGRYDNDGRYGNDRYDDNYRYENNRYNGGRDPRGVSYKGNAGRKDNGNHNGWNKKQRKGGCD